jgi:hypothetical protein
MGIRIRIRIQNTGGGTVVKFAAGVNNSGGKFATVEAMPMVTLPPVSWAQQYQTAKTFTMALSKKV